MVDLYTSDLQGQSIDITNIPNGIYYLYSIANPTKAIEETNYDNNAAWVSLRIHGIPGSRSAQFINYSVCNQQLGLCGRNTPSLSRTENGTDEMDD